MNQYGTDADDTADGEAARVAHEDLCGEAVVPEEAYQCADKGGEENNQLFAARDVHHIEIVRPDATAADVGECNERRTDDGRIACAHAVHAVVEVGTVAHGSDHEDG